MYAKILYAAAVFDFGPRIGRQMAKAHAFPLSAPRPGRRRGNRHLVAAPDLNSGNLKRNALDSAGRVHHRPFGYPPVTQIMKDFHPAAPDRFEEYRFSPAAATEGRLWLRCATAAISIIPKPSERSALGDRPPPSILDIRYQIVMQASGIWAPK
jgi:hypothetical protein